jgi:beta-phosphoglucomutase-like phosphatase (HAD superfamily)
VGKPHPEPYEKACTALGYRHDTVWFSKDSETGCRSGNAAGALVVAIPAPCRTFRGLPADSTCVPLAELDVATLARMLEHFDGD